MGYMGLLLNDPYKIDRMGCVCGLISNSVLYVGARFLYLGYNN
jgi:hypothetical protein